MPEGNGKCSVCTGEGQCPGGTYCTNGRCLRCGEEQGELCSSKLKEDPSTEAAPYGFCKIGAKCKATDIAYKCTNMVGGDTITTLPDGKPFNTDVGICLPDPEPAQPCAFSWFNPTASANPGKPLTGQCPSTAPYCTPKGCVTLPFSEEADLAGGVVCGKIAGVPSGGMAGTQGSAGSYDITGLCSGILVPIGSYANIATFTADGKPSIGASTCLIGNDNPAKKDCGCTTGKDGDCPLGTFCQKLSLGPEGSTKGICTISATGTTGLGFFYANSACVANSFGLPVCKQLNSQVLGGQTFAGGPGEFCYLPEQCLYQGVSQNNPLRALTCLKNQCLGIG